MSDLRHRVETPGASRASAHAEVAGEKGTAPEASPRAIPPILMVAGLAALLAVPLAVALGVLYEPRWLPLSDVAQLEMRVRDVATGHPPQVGLAGRFVAYDQIGSHPGALVFYLLWPIYWLVGGDGWALLVATATLTFVGICLAIWIAIRRGGWRLALLVAGTLAVLLHAHGAATLVEAWTPYVVIVWWVAFLLGLWSVLCHDLAMLPVAVFAGSLCMQTHVSYVALVLGTAVLAGIGGVALELSRRGREPFARFAHSPAAGRWLAWGAVSAGLALALWLPPLIEQATNDPGNVTILVESFRNPGDQRVPLSLAAESWMAHLNPVELFTGALTPLGSGVPGLLFVALWAAAIAAVWRRRDAVSIDLLRLHIVVAAGTVLGLLATAGIYGALFAYLVLFGWGTTALMVFATVWSIVSLLPTPRQRPVLAVASAGCLVIVALFIYDAAHAELRDATLSNKLADMTAATLDRLEDDPAGCGDSCSYLVTWSDPHHVGSEGFGLLVALERQGVDARATTALEPAVRGHRVIEPAEADAVIHVALSEDVIDEARSREGAEQIAYADPYTPQEHARHDELRQELVAALIAEGFDDLVETAADGRKELVPIDDDMSDELVDLIEEANAVYRPSAVFLIPVA